MILPQAVLHIPLSQYAFANSPTSLTLRLRTARGALGRCVLHYGDRVQPSDPITFTPVEMELAASDRLYDYYEATFESPYTRVCYYFELLARDERVYLYADILSPELPGERSEFYQYPFIRREEISTVPDWLKNAVVYNIFPDSFASGKRSIACRAGEMAYGGTTLRSRLGGTIRGITANLDYIADLGFNCIYINPIFVAGEYHKYDLLDYRHISPDLGTDEDFRALVDTAHAMGIRVIIDGVFNHCSWYFFAFDDVVRHGEQSAYKNWFYDLRFPVVRPQDPEERPTYSSFAYERKMPKLNSSDPQVRAYFLDVCVYWIREFHVDGWRLDVANEVDKDFWREFKKTARSIDPDSVMIGEIWESAERWLQGDMFDSTMNYDFRKNCRDFFGLERITASEFITRIDQMHFRYPTGVVQGQLNLLDSHDVSRFLSCCGGDIRRLRLAEVFLFTAPGVPCVFYGDELGMDGREELALRGPMPWQAPPADGRDFFRQLIALRRSHPVLVYGAFRVVETRDEGLVVFQRRDRGGAITVALNARGQGVDLRGADRWGTVRMSYALEETTLGPYGYGIWADGDN